MNKIKSKINNIEEEIDDDILTTYLLANSFVKKII